MKLDKSIITICLLIFTTISYSQTSQWRGENRDGKFNGEGLIQEWPENGPEKLLVVEGIGKGWSSVILHDETMYVTGMIDTLDYLTAIDMEGNIKYQVAYGESWKNSYPDTRSTPTIEENRLYIISGIGELVCINIEDGTTIWKVNVDGEFESEWSRFGVSESPLIVEDKVICTPGGNMTSMVAFDKITGAHIWQTIPIGGKRVYSSPVLYTYEETQFIIGQTSEYVFAVEPNSGEIRWKFLYMHTVEDPEKRSAPFTNTPLINGREIFISCGYDYHTAMLELNKELTEVTEKWTDTIFDNHHHGLILHEGYIYGSNWQNNRKGNWVCMEWETGEIQYEHKWGTKGEIIFADNNLYLLEEKSGNVGLVRPTPDRFELISYFKMEEGEGPYWSHPTIFDGKLFLRHGSVLVVYNIKE